MAKAEARKNTRAYHSFVAVLLLISGVGALGVGVWLRFTDRGDFLDLDFSGTSNGAIEAITSTDVGLMLIGAFLILSSIASLIALARNCIGYTFRVIYAIMAVIILVVLLGTCAASIAFLTNRNNSDVKDFFATAWENGVGEGEITSPDDVAKSQAAICKIESTFNCRGFEDNDCVVCPTGNVLTEPACAANNSSRCALCGTVTNVTASEIDVSNGCYNDIANTLRNAFLPSAIVSGILAVVVLIDIFFTCCL